MFTKQDGEFIVLRETPKDLQKKIDKWLAANYCIKVIEQNSVIEDDGCCWVIASILRKKLD